MLSFAIQALIDEILQIGLVFHADPCRQRVRPFLLHLGAAARRPLAVTRLGPVAVHIAL